MRACVRVSLRVNLFVCCACSCFVFVVGVVIGVVVVVVFFLACDCLLPVMVVFNKWLLTTHLSSSIMSEGEHNIALFQVILATIPCNFPSSLLGSYFLMGSNNPQYVIFIFFRCSRGFSTKPTWLDPAPPG